MIPSLILKRIINVSSLTDQLAMLSLRNFSFVHFRSESLTNFQPPPLPPIKMKPFIANRIEILNPELRKVPLGCPIIIRSILEDPNPIKVSIENPFNRPAMEDIQPPSVVEKQAARLVVIRRHKMNVHKLKKLRRKMKYIWAKVKLRRSIRKEKAFLNNRLAEIKAAEKFDAKAYVAEIIRKAKDVPIPRRWKGHRMPAWWIKEEMEKERKRLDSDATLLAELTKTNKY